METIEAAPAQTTEQTRLKQAIKHYTALQKDFADLVKSADQCQQMADASDRESQEANQKWKAQLASAPNYRPTKDLSGEIDRSMRTRTLADQYQATADELGQMIKQSQIPLAESRLNAETLQNTVRMKLVEHELAEATLELKDLPEFQRWAMAIEAALTVKVPQHLEDYDGAYDEAPGMAAYRPLEERVKRQLAIKLMQPLHDFNSSIEAELPESLRIPNRVKGELGPVSRAQLRNMRLA